MKHWSGNVYISKYCLPSPNYQIDLDHLYLYNFSTWPLSIQEILEYKLISDKHAFNFDRISHSFNLHPQKQSSTHQIISERISSKISTVISMFPYDLGLLQNTPSHPFGCHLILGKEKTLPLPGATSFSHMPTVWVFSWGLVIPRYKWWPVWHAHKVSRVCTYIYLFTWAFTHIYVCVYVCLWVCICACILRYIFCLYVYI